MIKENIPIENQIPPKTKPIIVKLQDVDKIYRTKKTESEFYALSKANLEIHDSEFVSIIGPSGCGKTTLLNLVAGLLEPTSGKVMIGDHSPDRAREAHEIGVVFQDAVLLPWKTSRENAAFLLEVTRGLTTETLKKVDQLLETVGLKDSGDKYPHQLSGGMRQRVSIARALSMDPILLLMDEPFGALDEFTRIKMNYELLKIWSQAKKTVLFVTHNIGEAVFLSDRVIAMKSRPGRIIKDLKIDLPRPRTRELRYLSEYLNYIIELQKLLEEEETQSDGEQQEEYSDQEA